MQQRYLLDKSPVNTCPDDFLVQNGDCADELLADSAHPLHSHLSPPAPACAGEYAGCNKEYSPVDLWVDDPDYPELCGHRIYLCGEQKFYIDPITCKHEPLPEMIKVTTTNAGNLEKVCETLDIPITITDPLSGTAEDLIALALAEGLAFPTYGDPVAEDVVAITGQSTGPVTYAGQVGDCIEDTEGVSATTEFDFPADCVPVNLNVCLRKCLTAAEVKALG